MSKSIQWLCIMCVLILPIISPAQVWVARYNGPGNDNDRAYAIALDNVGNVYVTGESRSGTNPDYATVKYNASGMEQWVARYNGPANNYDVARAIALDNAGNVHVTGFSVGSYTATDYATVKYNSSGTQQWVARYAGTLDASDEANAIALDNSGNVYVTGTSNFDYATVKYNSSGTEQWVARYNGGPLEWANAIALDNVGNVYVTGTSGSSAAMDYATVKYNSSGVEQWVARYNGPGNGSDGAYAIAIDNAGCIYVTGGSAGSGTNKDYATIKYDSAGVEQWVARYNGPGNYIDGAYAIALDDASNAYVTGGSYGSGTDYDYATVKYNASGMEQWVARYNDPGNGEDEAAAIALDNSGNVCVTGMSSYDYATVKYNSSGTQQWVARYDGPGNSIDFANAIAVDNVDYVCVTGGSYGSGTDYDYATIKYLPTGIAEERATSVENSCRGATIFHGPLQLPEGKKCKVYDITGRIVMQETMKPGVYFIEIDGVVTQKVVKIR
jgi:uncharacterized delta-60 repeat protein